MPNFNIVLIAPEIPGNTGSIGRTCVALNARLILIKPYGFDLSEKAVRRAGLDYWKHVDIVEYKSIDEFFAQEKPKVDHLHLFSRFAKKSYFENNYTSDSYLVFGSETKGLPADLMQKYEDSLCSLPSFSEHIRSLNLSNAVTAASFEVIRQLKP